MRTSTSSPDVAPLRLEDVKTGLLREAYVQDGRLERVLFIGAALPPRDWLIAAFEAPELTDEMRKWLLFGRAPGAAPDNGPIVCACAGVGARAIERAIGAGARDVEAIGQATRAGVTCGSCRPELQRMLARERRPALSAGA
jgi:assimilatory nitrate reductase catalytic subunit